MRLSHLMIFFFLTALAHCSWGQSSDSKAAPTVFVLKNAPMHNALFVLRSEAKTLELDPKKDGVVDITAIERKDVKYVTVLKDKEARKLYGDKGANGVVIVQFADDYVLSRENFVKPLEDGQQ